MSVMFRYKWCGSGGIEAICQKSKVYDERSISLRGIRRNQYKVYNVNRKAMEWVAVEDCEII